MHAVSVPQAPFAAMSGAAQVHQIPVWQDNFSWILVCTQTKEAAVVDGAEADAVLEYVRRCELQLTTILTTHTHADHIGLHRDLQKLGLLEELRVVGNRDLARKIPGLTEGVGEGDIVKLGALSGRVMLTEGHLDGHISFLFGDVLFCGDTLFAGGCGYLFDGPPAKMHESLMRLGALDGDTRVCCAHEYTQDNLRFAWSVEPDNEALAQRIRSVWAVRERGESSLPSMIADEIATNPFLRTHSHTIRANVHAALPDMPIDTSDEVFAATRKLKDLKRYKTAGDAGLPV
jgi:hydroxyacylglutathione hydrolase